MKESIEFYKPVDCTNIRKVKEVKDPDSGVRLYCDQANMSWCLQVRGMLKCANRQDGKDFIVASAYLNRETLVAMREAIDDLLKEE